MSLGYVLAPWEITRTAAHNSTGPFLRPHDPYYYQRGEEGYYYDTQLGQLPYGDWGKRASGTRIPFRLGLNGLGQIVYVGQGKQLPNTQIRPTRWTSKLTNGKRLPYRLGRAKLGAIPTDEELTHEFCYTPVHSAWVASFQNNKMVPIPPTVQLGSVEDDQKLHNRRMLFLTIMSTVAVVGVSAMNFYRSAKAVKSKTY